MVFIIMNKQLYNEMKPKVVKSINNINLIF